MSEKRRLKLIRFYIILRNCFCGNDMRVERFYDYFKFSNIILMCIKTTPKSLLKISSKFT